MEWKKVRHQRCLNLPLVNGEEHQTTVQARGNSTGRKIDERGRAKGQPKTGQLGIEQFRLCLEISYG